MKKIISAALALVLTLGLFTVVAFAADSRLSVRGAQIRIPTSAKDDLVQGLRFISSVSLDVYELVDEADRPTSASDTGVGYGTVVMPTAILGTNELTKDTVINYGGRNFAAKVVPAVRLYAKDSTHVEFTAVMTGITEANYETKYTAVPYVTYMDGEEEVTIYGEAYSTSLFAVAEEAYADKKTTEYVKEYLLEEILNVVDPDKYEFDGGWTPVYRP